MAIFKKIFILLMIGGIFIMGISSAKSTVKFIEIDASKRLGKIIHGAIGGHYALSEPDVPSILVLSSLKIYTVNQKLPYGMQHPGADALRVAETFFKAGGKFLQVYLQDIYANWPYEKGSDIDNDGIPDDFLQKVESIVKNIKNTVYASKIVYVPFNEPDAIWYNNDSIWRGDINNSTFLKAWKKIYDFIKGIDKGAVIAGPNLAIYKADFMKNFMTFCKENNCIPDIITWHELNNRFYGFYEKNYQNYREIEKSLNIEPRHISINEYGTFSDLSVPGKLVQWISRFERTGVSACLAYWHTAGNFDDLVVDNNSPNGGWWVYKWYSDMDGELLETKVPYPNLEDLSALSVLNEKNKMLWVLFGGDDTDIEVNISNLPDDFIGKVFVKVYKADWSGYDGALFKPSVILEEIRNVENAFLKISIPRINKTSAYFLIMQKTEKDKIYRENFKSAQLSYEAELAKISNAKVFDDGTETNPNNNMYSNGKGVLLENTNSSLIFEVDLPYDGTYMFDIFYSNGNRQNNSGLIVDGYMKIDDGKYTKISLNPTTNWRFVGKHTGFIYFKRGKHKIIISRNDGKNMSLHPFDLDKISFTYVTSEKVHEDVNPQIYEAEEARLDDGLSLYYSKACSGASLVSGIGSDKKIKFVVSVDEDAYYLISIAYSTYGKDYIKMKLTLNYGPYKILNLPYTESIDKAFITNQVMFLQRGINILEISGVDKSKLCLDYIEIRKTHNYDHFIRKIEAEDKQNIISGRVKIFNSSYASSGGHVGEIGMGDENYLKIFLPNIVEDGYYAIVVHYSNGEILGTHQYNVNVIDRCALFELDDRELGEFYFRNTNGFETFKTKVIYTKLEVGNNFIKIYNPHKISSPALPSPWAPNIDKISVCPVFIE
jgi:hypothetical protein